MENTRNIIKKCATMNDEYQMLDLLNAGLDPNFDGGWPIRIAARYGSYAVVHTLIQYGANPYLLEETGASTLQLAVFSSLHWETDRWSFLLSCYDSSQLADGAAVAIVFKNLPALNKILQTGRCNTHIPTTLTGRTLEQLAKGYKMQHLLTVCNTPDNRINNTNSPQNLQRRNISEITNLCSPIASTSSVGQLSPSVAHFFNQTAGQAALTPPHTLRLPQGSPYSLQ